jgi:hypothetical protein
MRHALAMLIAAGSLMTAHPCVQAQDIAAVRDNKGNTVYLTSDSTPQAGFLWYHVESPQGRRLATGWWTPATRGRVMMTNGHGGAVYVPISRFSTVK